MKMDKIKTKAELYSENIISAKIKRIKNPRKTPIFNNKEVPEFIDKTMYLKICWHCGRVYESKQICSYACSQFCSQHIYRRTSKGLNPIARMYELTKPKNTKEIKAKFGYR